LAPLISSRCTKAGGTARHRDGDDLGLQNNPGRQRVAALLDVMQISDNRRGWVTGVTMNARHIDFAPIYAGNCAGGTVQSEGCR